MRRHLPLLFAAISLAMLTLAVTEPAAACSLCLTSLQQSIPWRVEAGRAGLVVYGTLENARLADDGSGTTQLKVQTVLKNSNVLPAGAQSFEIPRYIPSEPNRPPHYLVFCNLVEGKIDAYRGVPEAPPSAIAYVKGSLAIDEKDRTKTLLYLFDYLEHPDKDIAADAFLEFARSSDQEIGQIASQLKADRIRGWLTNPKTPSYRLGLYAFLLGACGNEADASLLRSLLEKPDERTTPALDGILGGYIQMRPKEGWDFVVKMLADVRKPFMARYAVLRTLRFYHGWKPEETKAQVLRGLEVLLPQGDVCDLAVEDLRRWQIWDLTSQVLAQYAKKSHSAPIVKRALMRYVLACPRPEAFAFAAERRRAEPDLVREVEESLALEKLPPQ